MTSTKRRGPAESRDRGGIWDPEVRREGGERKKRGGSERRKGGQTRGRAGRRAGAGRGETRAARRPHAPGEREARGGGAEGGGRQVRGREDAGDRRVPVGSTPRAGRGGPRGRSSARLRGGAGRAGGAPGMSQVLPAAGSVLQRSVAAPGNQPQPQVVD